MQPFHEGHLSIITKALSVSDRLMVGIGSANGPRSHRNPFTYKEREQMSLLAIPPADRDRVTFFPVADYLYNEDRWIEAVQHRVSLNAEAIGAKNDISLIGHSKDSSSYYLKMFPRWGAISAPNFKALNATAMREAYFRKGAEWLTNGGAAVVPKEVRDFLIAFAGTETFHDLVEEYEFVRDYRKKWGPGPYVTTDSCVIQSGHVLMIRRGGRPGKGLLALPGGFLNIEKNESIIDGTLRELDEETHIDVPPGLLRGSIVHTEAFGDPYRDPRARIITHASLISLPKQPDLPSVRADDDAADAHWVPLGDLREELCFADHWHIIQRMRGFLPS
jgi:bifunctional NMN adenylyltransferase/nudix hydrolase